MSLHIPWSKAGASFGRVAQSDVGRARRSARAASARPPPKFPLFSAEIRCARSDAPCLFTPWLFWATRPFHRGRAKEEERPPSPQPSPPGEGARPRSGAGAASSAASGGAMDAAGTVLPREHVLCAPSPGGEGRGEGGSIFPFTAIHDKKASRSRLRFPSLLQQSKVHPCEPWPKTPAPMRSAC
jgi:hypothetical protein